MTDSSLTVQFPEQPQTYKDSIVSSYQIALLLILTPLLAIGCGEKSAEAETLDAVERGKTTQNVSLESSERDAPRTEQPGHRTETPPPGLDSAELHDTTTLAALDEADEERITTGETEGTKVKIRPPLTYHRGVNYADIWSSTTGYGSGASARQHKRLRAIGVNSIAVTPFGFQEGATSNGLVGFMGEGPIQGKWNRDEEFGREVALARESGLRVMMKPHIWSHDFWNGKEWHGTVRQSTAQDHKTWWASYRKFILHYARFSQRTGVDALCIGTELVKMSTSYPDEWRALIRDVREIYDGELTYAAHWDREWREIQFWGDLDYIGIASYFPLEVSDSATVEELADAWEPHKWEIAQLARTVNRPVLFLEVGYRPIDGAWREPWKYSGGRPNREAPAQAFRGLFRAFEGESWFRGVYIWKVFTDTKGWGRDEEDGFRIMNLPVERVIDSVFSQR